MSVHWRGVALRVLAIVVLLGGYLLMGRPLRNLAAEHLLYPVVRASVASEAAAVQLVGRPPRVEVRHVDSAQSRTVRFPPGVYYVLSAGALLLYDPSRSYWLGVWGALTAVGLLGIAAYLLGWAGLPGGLYLGEFLAGYVVPGTALLLPFLIILPPERFALPSAVRP